MNPIIKLSDNAASRIKEIMANAVFYDAEDEDDFLNGVESDDNEDGW